MKTIQRYILREFIVPLFYTLTGFVSIYVLFELFGSFSRMMDSHVGFGTIVLYLCGYLAPFFHYLAPAALMLATLYTMWSMCRHSEIVAMRASGISFLSIAGPLLAVAFAMALFVAFVSEWFVPHFAQWAFQLKTARFDAARVALADNVMYQNPGAHRTWNVDSLGSTDASELRNVRVTFERPTGGRLKTVTAACANYLDGEWWLSGVKVQHYDLTGREISSPTPEFDALPFRAFPELNERPGDFLLQNRPWKYNSVRDRQRYLAKHTQLEKSKRDEYVYDMWAQALAPFACLVITLFAIPAGIASGRQSVMKGILGALGLFFLFYGLTLGLMALARAGLCPPILAAFLPDVLFLSLGIRAFIKQM